MIYEKKNRDKGRVIFSLQELPQDVEFVTDQGNASFFFFLLLLLHSPYGAQEIASFVLMHRKFCTTVRSYVFVVIFFVVWM